MVLATATPRPTLTPTAEIQQLQPTEMPKLGPTTDALQLTPSNSITPVAAMTAKSVLGVIFDTDGQSLGVVQTNGVYFYSIDKLALVKHFETSRTKTDPTYNGSTDTLSASVSPNLEWLALGQWYHYNSAKGQVQRGVITIVQIGTGVLKVIGLDQNPNTVAAPFIHVRYTPDNLIVAGEMDSNNGEVQIWETKGNLLFSLPVLHGLKNLDFSTKPNVQQFAICAVNGEIEVHDTKKGTLLASLGRFTNDVASASCGVAYSHSGDLLAYYGDDQLINLWDNRSSLVRHLPGHDTPLNQILFSPDDKSLATLGNDGLVRVWSIDGHKALLSWSDHSVGINWLRYSPDGHYLFGGGADGRIRVWSPVNNHLIAAIEGVDVAFSPDNSLMGTFTADGTVMLWRMDGLAPQK